MAWFAWQSALFILLGFLLGAVVGWWFWRIQWRRAAFTESEAVTVISRRHEKTVAAKDAEISRLSTLLAGSSETAEDEDAVVADAVAASATSAEDADGTGTSTGTADDTAGDAADGTAGDAADGTAGDAADGTAGDAADDTTDDAADGADAAPLVVELPESGTLPAGTVVDVTDDALATDEDGAAERETVAHAVAQLPTQSTGEDVIDVTAAEGADGVDDASGDAASEEAPGAEPGDAPADDAAPSGEGAAPATAATAAPLASVPDDEPAHDGTEDDLERIEGIGPRIASALRTAGIRSFRRLADADVPALQAALENAGLRFAPSLPTWSRQARFLADGDEVGFIKLTESLVAGREPGRSR